MMSMESLTSTNPSSPTLISKATLSTQNSLSNSSREPEAHPPSSQEIAKKPWKYVGYKGYSEFLASENDFFIFRKFALLNSRTALALQDQLSVLEGELEELDKRYSKKSASDVNNGSYRDDQADREELLGNIYDKLVKYSEYRSQSKKWIF